jgi:hypothetical protein
MIRCAKSILPKWGGKSIVYPLLAASANQGYKILTHGCAFIQRESVYRFFLQKNR